jgi:hypothetical protein
MPDDYVDADGRIRWIEPQSLKALAPPPARDEHDEDDDEDGDDEDGDDEDAVRVAPHR